jgi:uncharacterized membrane protein
MPSLKRIKSAALSVLMWTFIVIILIIFFTVRFASTFRIWVDLGIWHFLFFAALGLLILIISLWRNRRSARRQNGPASDSKGTT